MTTKEKFDLGLRVVKYAAIALASLWLVHKCSSVVESIGDQFGEALSAPRVEQNVNVSPKKNR